jgi:transglutaminase-like putative cysteine protease
MKFQTAPIFAAVVAAGALQFVHADPADNQQVVTAEYLLPAGSRTFAVEYVSRIKDIPSGAKLVRLWVPLPQDSTVQTVKDLSFSKAPTLITREPKYGNKIAYWEIADPPESLEITIRFVCMRREIRVDLAKLAQEGEDAPAAYEVFRQPDALVVVDDTIKKLAERVTAGKTTTLQKARAIYDYVLGQMTYDKNHDGWGTGSTTHACEVGKGNCTDYHALFNSLCRAQGIASGFEIGLYLPYEKNSAEPLGGYHCWAFFRVPGKTWVPVDCSEADRFEKYREFFFGGHTSNRVTLSTGRDITLVPKQQGKPLNYFLNPYAEADGKAVKTSKDWSFKDLD